MSNPYNFVNFVCGKETLSMGSTRNLFKRRTCENGAMSGDEAKRFYESVVSSGSSCTNDGSSQDSGTKKVNSSLQSSYSGNTGKTQSKRTKYHSHSSSTNGVDDCLFVERRTQRRRESRSSVTQGRLVNEFLRNAQNGNLKDIKKVVHENELDINVTDQFSWSGLMCAAQGGHIHVVRFLLKQGAMWEDVRDAKGQNALDLAKLAGHEAIVLLLERQRGQGAGSAEHLQASCLSYKTEEKQGQFWCSICQQEFTDNQKKHERSTVHLFKCQHEPKRTFYYIPEGNVGYQMMLKSGWKEEKGLGPEGIGRKFPVKTVLKRDRSGFGIGTNKKARVTHFGPGDESAIKGRRAKKDKKERVQRKVSKKEKQAKKRNERMWEQNLRIYMNTD